VRTVPRLCEFYPGICLTTDEKARKNFSQGKKNLSRGKKNLSQSTVSIGSILAAGVDVLSWVLCVVRWRYRRRSDYSSGGVLPSVLCPMSVIAKLRKERPWPGIWQKRRRKKLSGQKPDAVRKKNIAASSLCTFIISIVSPVHYYLSSCVSFALQNIILDRPVSHPAQIAGGQIFGCACCSVAVYCSDTSILRSGTDSCSPAIRSEALGLSGTALHILTYLFTDLIYLLI